MSSILHQILERSDFSPVTRDKYRRVIDSWLDFAGTDPRGWTRMQAQAWYDATLARGVSPRSANVYAASLRYVSKWYATQTGAIDFAVIQTRKSGSNGLRGVGDEAPQRALTRPEAEALLATCAGARTPIEHRDRTLLVLGLETGMRRMSLAGCAFERINKQTIVVPIKGPGGEVEYPVPLSDAALHAIGTWRAWLRKRDAGTIGPLFPRLTRELGPRGLFVYQLGDGISKSAIYKLVESRARAAGIVGMHPHLLRHTFVTWRQEAGLSPIQIASITGHKTFGDEWRNMAPYVDMSVLAEQARNSTPPWLAALVKEWK